SASPPPLLSAPLSIWLRPYHQAPTSVGASFLLWPFPSIALRTGRMDNLPLRKLHGSHVDLSIADQTVKTYIVLVAGEAAPSPPPSDPLLATPDSGRILLPRPRSIRVGASPPPLRRTHTFDLASALS